MGNAHSGFGLVDMLAAGALRAHRIDLQIRFINIDIHILGFGQNRDGCRRSMDAALGFGFRHPLHPMRSGLEFQPCEDTAPRDFSDDFLVTPRCSLTRRQNLDAPALQLGIALIHPEQIAGEKRRLIAAGSSANFENGIFFIRRVLWQKCDLEVLFEFKKPCTDRP